MTTLTDRYVWAAARTLPDRRRREFDRELRERIGDASDALTAEGSPPDRAEYTALAELGDPAALAAGYVDRPLQLLGPRYFLVWWRLLTLLYAIVLPIATAAVVLAQILTGSALGEIIGTAVVTALTLVVHLTFWTTLVFALIDRLPDAVPIERWTPELLPQLPDPGRSNRLGELVASCVLLAVVAGAIVGQQFTSGFVDAEGQPIPIIDPALWAFWLPYFLGLIVLEALFALVIYARGWNWLLVGVNIVLSVAFAAPGVWLVATERVLNPAWAAATGRDLVEATAVTSTVVSVAIVSVSVWDMVDGVVKTWRRRSAARLAVG